ncbi:50S ribosomal protein L20P [Ochromonadaceae sp. CCMP2298]|nr:50S ribosomal protein L20P [Ochromonadaceae sp. CCMP2298]
MANHRHKKIIKLAKGYKGRANRCFTVALPRVIKARQYAYRDRKVKKREFRALWIQRINAASRMYGLPYSVLMHRLEKSDVGLNRKVLADLAVTEPLSFKSVVEVAKLYKEIKA